MAKCEPLDYAAEAETQGASERNIVVVRSPICYGQKGGAGKEGVKEGRKGAKDKQNPKPGVRKNRSSVYKDLKDHLHTAKSANT